MYIAGIFILVFFAVIGLASFVGGLVKAHLSSDTDGFILMIPHVDADNAEARIRSAAMMTDSVKGCRIICVCSGDDPAHEICEKLLRQYPQVEIVEAIDSISGT